MSLYMYVWCHLEIPVYDPLLMAVLYGGDDLSELGARLLLLHAPVEHEVVEHLEQINIV